MAEFTPDASPERARQQPPASKTTPPASAKFMATPAPSPTPFQTGTDSSPLSSPQGQQAAKTGSDTTLSYAHAAALRLAVSVPPCREDGEDVTHALKPALPVVAEKESDETEPAADSSKALWGEGPSPPAPAVADLSATSSSAAYSSMLRTLQSARHFGEANPGHPRRYSMPSRFGGLSGSVGPPSSLARSSHPPLAGVSTSSSTIPIGPSSSYKQHSVLAEIPEDTGYDRFPSGKENAIAAEQLNSRPPSQSAWHQFDLAGVDAKASYDTYSGLGGKSTEELNQKESYEKYLSNAMGAPTANSLTCYLVQFTSGRTDTFYIPADHQQHQRQFTVNIGDYVVVEADRGEDLGRVIMDNIKVPLPRRNSTASSTSLRESPTFEMEETTTMAMGGGGVANVSSSSAAVSNFPKKIYRLAQPGETESLLSKIRDEINAIAVGQYKVQEWKLPMAIIDAEYQWDRRKLTFFFSVTLPQFYPNQPSPRIDFRTLVRDLYQIYRTRIWMYCVDKDKNRSNRAHNREKFLKQLYKDSLNCGQQSAGINLNASHLAPIGSGLARSGAHSMSSSDGFQSTAADAHYLSGGASGTSAVDYNTDEWDISDVLGSLHREATVDVEDLAYGMAGMHVQHRHERSMSLAGNKSALSMDDAQLNFGGGKYSGGGVGAGVFSLSGQNGSNSTASVQSIWGGGLGERGGKHSNNDSAANYHGHSFAASVSDQQQQQQHGHHRFGTAVYGGAGHAM